VGECASLCVQGELSRHDADLLLPHLLSPLSSSSSLSGHLTFLVAPALSSIYDFSPASVPLLSRLHSLAQALLTEQFTSQSTFSQNNPSSSSSSSRTTFPPSSPLPRPSQLEEKIGFVVSPFSEWASHGYLKSEASDGGRDELELELTFALLPHPFLFSSPQRTP